MKNKSNTNNKLYNYHTFPLIFIIGIIPLIMRYKEFNSKTSKFAWDVLDSLKTDTAFYYKSKIFILTFAIMLLIAMYEIFKQQKKKDINIKQVKLFIPLALYALMAIFSTVFSKYRYFSIHGMMNHFESIFVLLGYCFIVYYCYLLIKTEKDIKFIIYGFSIFVVIMGIIGIFQYMNMDFWTSDFGKKLMLPSKYSQNGTIKNTMTSYKVNLSLANPNYVGLYVGIIIPFFGTLTFFKLKELLLHVKTENTELTFNNNTKINNTKSNETKNKEQRINLVQIAVYVFIIISMIVSLMGSNSSNGIIAILASVMIAFFIMIVRISKNNKYIAGGIILILICFIGTSFYLVKPKINEELSIYHKDIALEDIKTNKDNVSITYKGNTLKLSYEYNSADGSFNIHFTDQDGKVLDSLYDKEKQILNDNRFNTIKFIPSLYNNEIVSLLAKIDGIGWFFTNQLKDGSYYYLNMVGRPDKIVTPESVLKGYETLGTGRGFIWGRTIPLLKDNIVIGSGPDTFVITYPQQDYIGNYYYFYNQLIDKPHNMYLQIGVQTGVLSLIALIIFWGAYILWSIKLFIKAEQLRFMEQTGIACLLASIGFLVSGLMNDSTITVTPVFWVVIGIGVAINYRISNEKKNEINN